ncbi:MAG TPA: cupin domain-containing protein [Myxococcota bacterium]|nr:cupin domain-containing protein [Myxococcota bacterium]
METVRTTIRKLTRWPANRLPPSRRDIERTLVEEGLRPFRMVDPPCTYYHTQSHSKYEVRVVVKGRIMIGIEDEQIELHSGDRLDLPAGTPYWIRILSDDGAVYLLASR